MKYYAHSLEGSSTEQWQPLLAHLENTAMRAARFAEPFGARDLAYYAGLLHDLGKYARAFQERLHGGPRVDHSTAGARRVVDEFGDLSGRLIAYCIAGHHSGLPDGKGSGQSTLSGRLKKKIPAIDNVAAAEIPAAQPPQFRPIILDQAQLGFQIAFYIRMLYSCLVDADFLDTENFLQPDKSAARRNYPAIAELEQRLDDFLDSSGFLRTQAAGTINRRRAEVLRQCLDAAEKAPTIFSLTVPTGGGKTVSSLAFALKHAKRHGLRRVIYVIPYTSIIEQNAAVFRDILGEDAVIEHHSNYDYREEDGDDVDYRAKLACENWDAPLIVTTNVRFFESLFAARSSKCRRLHNIADSVVVLDEAQMLPPPYLYPCIEALRELARNYRGSIVLCTATQPALTTSESFPRGLSAPVEIVADPVGLAREFKRVRVSMAGELSDDELVARLAACERALCIVNTRRHARELYDLFEKREKFGENCGGIHHLSALMCPAHRSARLAEIKEKLRTGAPCRLIATQLVEAGVDISFPVVYRAVSGLDSIAQAAGRCNRHGELPELGEVFVFKPQAGLPPGHFRQTADIGTGVLDRFAAEPLSPRAVEAYFRELFWRKGEGLDEKDILADLNEGSDRLDFPFKQVAEKFRFIENEQISIIIPWQDGAGLVEEFRHTEFPHTFIRKLQRFTVQLPRKIAASLLAVSSVELLHNRFFVLVSEDLYRDDVGLCPEDPYFHEVESLVI